MYARFFSFWVALVILWPIPCLPGQAQRPKGSKTTPACSSPAVPWNITADRMTFDVKDQSFLFEGHVHVRRCDMTLRCDRLRLLSTAPKTAATAQIVAMGNVQFQQGDYHVVAERAQYFAAEQKLVLSGVTRAWSTQKHHELAGEHMVIFLQERRIVIKGARARFYLHTTQAQNP